MGADMIKSSWSEPRLGPMSHVMQVAKTVADASTPSAQSSAEYAGEVPESHGGGLHIETTRPLDHEPLKSVMRLAAL